MKTVPALAVGSATLLALALRVNDLGRLGLGTDEAHSAWMAAQPMGDLPRLLGADSAPPLYYVLLHGWQALFPTDVGLRSLSVVFGIAAVPVVYLAARRMVGERAACAAAFLMAVANFHIDHSQSAKFYSLYFLAGVMALLALLAACEHPARRSLWAAYGVALAALLYTHAVAPFIVMGLAAFGMIRLGRRLRANIRAFAGAHLLALLLFLPWLRVAMPQAISVLGSFWAPMPSLSSLFRTIDSFLLIPPKAPPGADPLITDAEPGLTALPFGSLLTGRSAAPLWLSIPWLALLLAVAVAALDRKLRPMLGLLALVLIPMAALFATSILWESIYLPRVLLPSLVAVPLLLAAPFGGEAPESIAGPGRERPLRLPSWLSRAAKAASIAAFGVMLAAGCHLPEVRALQAWREAGRWISERAADSDAVVYNSHLGQYALERYLSGAAAGLVAFGLPSDWYDGNTPTPAKWVRSSEDLARLHDAAAGHDVIWLVQAHTSVHDPQEIARAWCEQNLVRGESLRLAGVEVIRYETRKALPGDGSQRPGAPGTPRRGGAPAI